MEEQAKPTAKIMRAEEVFWEQPPGHFDAFSKLLVHPKTSDTRYLDFRLSSYRPKGYIEVHAHKVTEHAYFFLQGRGLMEIDGQKHLVKPHTVVHIPAGVRHGIFNTGLEDLVFVVAGSPPDDTEVKPVGERRA